VSDTDETPARSIVREDLWLPADLLLTLLKEEAIRTGDKRLRVTRKTLNTWVRRGHVEYLRGRGYRVTGRQRSVTSYLAGRGTRGLRSLST
jgi:hypothetical protein